MERWATVKRIHQAALEREADQRATFLDEARAGDEKLRREVEFGLTQTTYVMSLIDRGKAEHVH